MKRSVLNKLLLLRLIDVSREISSYRKVSQLVFILQVEGRKEKRMTFNYEFTKWSSEPYSVELEKDLQQLDKEKLTQKQDWIMVTKKGYQLIQKTSEYFSNHPSLDTFFRFFSYLHANETLYETCTCINEKYELTKLATDEIICDIEEFLPEECMEEQENDRIQRNFEELESTEQEYIEAVKEMFTKNGARK